MLYANNIRLAQALPFLIAKSNSAKAGEPDYYRKEVLK